MAEINLDMGLLCSILLSYPQVILIVPNVSAKDKFKSHLNPHDQVLHNSQINENFKTDRRNIRILNNNIRCCSRKEPISNRHMRTVRIM